MVSIAPSILAADFAYLADAVKLAETGGAGYLHVDVMDGQFVPNISIGVPVVQAIRRITSLPLDVHLMIVDPDRYLEAFAKAGADVLVVHSESTAHLHRTIQAIHALGKRARVAINPATPLHALEDVLDDLDAILIMSVNPGFGGQSFIPRALDKIRRCRTMIGDRDIEIEVDGGVDATNAAELAEAGADVLVAGTAIYGAADPLAAMRAIREAAEAGARERATGTMTRDAGTGAHRKRATAANGARTRKSGASPHRVGSPG